MMEVRSMKVKVIQRFNDRVTKERREAGQIYEYPAERAKELEQAGYVKQMVKPEQENK